MNTDSNHRTPLDVRAAAKYSGLPDHYLNRLRVKGGGPLFVKVGGRVLYLPDDLDAWLLAHKRRSTSDMEVAVSA
jgi:hypothetical protein